MTSLQQLLANGRLRLQSATPEEIRALLAVSARDEADARETAISDDRRFATAYNGALQLATVVLRAEGYRTKGAGHHSVTIMALATILGDEVRQTADYLDACRSRRNTVDYNGIGIATEADVEELLTEIERLRVIVLEWLRRTHPELIPDRS